MTKLNKSIQILVFTTFCVTSFVAVATPILAAGAGIPVIRRLTATPGTQINPGQTLTPQATAIGGDGNLTYHWSGACNGSGTGREITGNLIDNQTPGTRNCTVRFCDTDGDCVQDSLPITVLGASNPNPNPIPNPATSRTTSVATSSQLPASSSQSTTVSSASSVTSSESTTISASSSALSSIISSSATTSIQTTDKQTCATNQRSIVSGKVFYDQNKNFVQNESEDEAVNIKITITYLDPEAELFKREVATDTIGHWQTDLCPGVYKLFLDPSQLSFGTSLISPESLTVTMKAEANISEQNFLLNSQISFSVSNFMNIARDYWWVGVIIGGLILLAILYVWTKATRVEYVKVKAAQ